MYYCSERMVEMHKRKTVSAVKIDILCGITGVGRTIWDRRRSAKIRKYTFSGAVSKNRS